MGIRNGKSVLLTRRSVLQAALVANTVLVARPWPAYASTSQGPVAETIYGKVRGSRVGEIHISRVFRTVLRPPEATDSDLRKNRKRGGVFAMHSISDTSRPKTPMESSCDPQMRRLQERSVPDELPPQGEDCLVLNVWTPALADGGKRPVMVMCHGGGFDVGKGNSPATDGTHLARQHNVVVVSFNHRLGAFGLLYLGDSGDERFADSGNTGMLDIVAVLQWIQTNIGQFGGDPGCVTFRLLRGRREGEHVDGHAVR